VQAMVTRIAVDDWRVSIHTASAAGHTERSLSARSCEPLADATSLIIAMMIDPETAATHAHLIAGLSESPVMPARDPVAAPTAPLVAPAAPLVTYPGLLPPPAPTRTRRDAVLNETKTIKQNPEFNASRPQAPSQWPTRGFASEWVMRDWGSLQVATEVFGGSVGLAHGPWSSEASLGVSLREDITQSTGRTIGSLRLLTGVLRVCWRAWEYSRVAVSPCAGFGWAWWSSQGNSNLANQRNEVAPKSAAEARVVGAFAVSETLSLLLPLDVVLPLKRPSFGYTAGGSEQIHVFEPSRTAVRLGAGLRLYFP